MYVSYDLAKAIQRDRLARSTSEWERRRNKKSEEPAPRRAHEDASVVELVFPSHCDTDQIGA